MIVYFLVDFLLNNIFALPSYFLIGYISNISKNDIPIVLMVALFYDFYYLKSFPIFLLILSLIMFINLLLLKKKSLFLKTLSGYGLFFMLNALVFRSESSLNVLNKYVLWVLLFYLLSHIVKNIFIYINR